MTEQNLITELNKRGYDDVSVSDITKNGVHLRGLTIHEDGSRISPMIYIDEILKDHEDPSSAADLIENIFSSHRSFDLGCSTDELSNPEFIKERVHIGVQKASDQNLIKRQSIYDGIEQYLFVAGNRNEEGRWSYKLNPQIIAAIGLDVDELWSLAEEHTFSEFTIQTLTDVLSGMLGDDTLELGDSIPMYIVSNTAKINGAACACDVEHIKAWATEKGFSRLAVLPSSTHEMIIVPVADESFDLEQMSLMVKEVNETQVQPQDRLTDRAYLLDVA